MKTTAISANEFVRYGCPCCCEFNVMFFQSVLNTRIIKCNKTNNNFHVVVGKSKKSAVSGDNGETVRVMEHPFGQIASIA